MSWTPSAGFYRNFPQLDQQQRNWRPKSEPTEDYNCIAFAAGDETRRWWPVAGRYWPPGFPRDETIENFEMVFSRWLGYRKCRSDQPEPGMENIAIFVNSNGVPTHAAKQLENGLWWKSKLGDSADIEHELRAIEGNCYGTAKLFMCRGRWGRFMCRLRMAMWGWSLSPIR